MIEYFVRICKSDQEDKMDEAQVDDKGPLKEEKATRDYKPRPSTPLDLLESSLFLYQKGNLGNT